MQSVQTVIDDAGGFAAVAKHFQISPQAVYKWIDAGVPADRVVALCELTDQKWIPQQLRPDIFGPAPTQREAA